MKFRALFNKYVKNTDYKTGIIFSRAFICTLPQKILPSTRNIFITTRSLKHIYDRHIFEKECPAHFYIILKNLHLIVGNPDRIYEDKADKKGNLLFVKKIRNVFYVCVLEIVSENEMIVISAFSSGEKYLKKFTLLWS